MLLIRNGFSWNVCIVASRIRNSRKFILIFIYLLTKQIAGASQENKNCSEIQSGESRFGPKKHNNQTYFHSNDVNIITVWAPMAITRNLKLSTQIYFDISLIKFGFFWNVKLIESHTHRVWCVVCSLLGYCCANFIFLPFWPCLNTVCFDGHKSGLPLILWS